MHIPLNCHEPFNLEDIELTNRYVADLGPGPILKRVIIQEFGAKHKSYGKHAVNLTTAVIVIAVSGQYCHALAKVVESKENGGAGQASR